MFGLINLFRGAQFTLIANFIKGLVSYSYLLHTGLHVLTLLSAFVLAQVGAVKHGNTKNESGLKR